MRREPRRQGRRVPALHQVFVHLSRHFSCGAVAGAATATLGSASRAAGAAARTAGSGQVMLDENTGRSGHERVSGRKPEHGMR